MTIGCHHQMSIIIRKKIEDREAMSTPTQHKVLIVFGGRTNLAEKTFSGGFLQNIALSPRCPDDIHKSKERDSA